VIISVIFTTDTHGNIYPCGCRVPLGGISERSFEIKRLRMNDQETLVLDNGSSLWGINHVVNRSNGKVIVEAMNEMKYAAMNLRATDLSYYTVSQIKELQDLAEFEFISSNLTIKNSELNLKEYIILNVKGVNIGVTGVSEFNKNSEEKYDYLKPEYALEKVIPKMKKESDFIIVLSGLSFQESANLPRMVPDIDLVISSPATVPVVKPRLINDSIIATSFREGMAIGHIELGFNIERKFTDHKYRHIQIQEGMPKDKSVQNILKKYQTREE